MTRQDAAAALDKQVAERDVIQGNLLDLEASFGKRVLSGAALAGVTRARWEAASATLARLWETFNAYAAVIDQAASLLGSVRDRELPQVTAVLTGRTVRLTRPQAPLARRDLADDGVDELTLPAAVGQMRRDFAEVAEVVSAAEAAWNAVGAILDDASARLTQADALARELGDDLLSSDIRAASAQVAAQRELLNTDPLSFLPAGSAAAAGGAAPQVDASSAARAREAAVAVAARAAELAGLRDGARQRIEALGATLALVTAARQEAGLARSRAQEKIAAGSLPPWPAPAAGLDRERLEALASGRQWQLLAAEVEAAGRSLNEALAAWRAAAAGAEAALGRRTELRGLLQAYKAKAARLGAAEDLGLTQRYESARDLLWTAPCDLAAAAQAVAAYQQAILAIGRG